jgi:hypothetical protein
LLQLYQCSLKPHDIGVWVNGQGLKMVKRVLSGKALVVLLIPGT